jgi:hypothetical protein
MTIQISGKTLAFSAGMIVLAAVAVAGWTRQSSAPASTATVNAAPMAPAPQEPVPVSPPETQSGYVGDWQPVGVSPAAQQGAPMEPADDSAAAPPPGSDDDSPAAAPPPNGPANGGPYDAYGQPESNAAPAPATSGYTPSQPVRQGRSTRTSVEIVAGSAAGGAAIGALAGGGKGAAIGALSGGAAGFVYDRLTHNQ